MYKLYFKRIIDVILCLIALPFFIVMSLPIMMLIKLEDGGPIFYNSERVGKNGNIFKMHKFRSMKVNAPDIRNKDGSTYNSKDDPRVTRVGKFIRETSLDETPQILNVLKGEMSIIGPRPGLESNLKTYKADEIDKLLVRPGITGYTQAYYRNSINMREKRLRDAWYANNISFALDLKIFFKTIVTIFKKEGLYTRADTVEDTCKKQESQL